MAWHQRMGMGMGMGNDIYISLTHSLFFVFCKVLDLVTRKKERKKL